ncbi:MAG TPA: CBS domain-containing protein [Gaiellales bacterium]|jgi:CBS domain-containing protein
MPQTVGEVMTRDPVTVQSDATIVDAARLMRDRDIGPLVVVDSGQVRGIVTDRDLVVRGLADGRDPNSVRIAEVCTGDVEAVSPDEPIADAVRRMEQRDVRRLPVVDGGRPVGIVAMGDLAVEGELPSSSVADISAASPNN